MLQKNLMEWWWAGTEDHSMARKNLAAHFLDANKQFCLLGFFPTKELK
jgi:hypothetical protein